MTNLFTLARSTDPDTSKAAARRASTVRDDSAAADVVRAVMSDVGRPMTDPEIAGAARVRGHKVSDGRLRHGRKWLSDRGLLVECGRRDGCRVWRLALG